MASTTASNWADVFSFSNNPEKSVTINNIQVPFSEKNLQDVLIKSAVPTNNQNISSKQQGDLSLLEDKIKELEVKNLKLETDNKQLSEWMENDSKTIEDFTAQLEVAKNKNDDIELVSCSA